MPPKTYQKTEKRDWKTQALFWLFVVAAVAGIAFMIHKMPKQKPLVCKNTTTSLNGFGNCHEEGSN